jgi:hypothetical protein
MTSIGRLLVFGDTIQRIFAASFLPSPPRFICPVI